MYTGRLAEPVDAEGTITLLCLADRFAISSCMDPLARVLKRFPSTLNDCLLVLGLPESLKADRAVEPVVEHCRSFLATQFQACSCYTLLYALIVSARCYKLCFCSPISPTLMWRAVSVLNVVAYKSLTPIHPQLHLKSMLDDEWVVQICVK